MPEPQAGDDVELTAVPDRCGYAYSPGWTALAVPAHDEELAPAMVVPAVVVDGVEVTPAIDVPAVVEHVPATYASVPPRARVLKTDLLLEDVTPDNLPALLAELEALVPATRATWGAPDDTTILVAYTFGG